ncbi:MAG: hypothetical protein ACI9WC_000724 [Arenicella sp.]|jgi:hypothetical protein
MQKKPQNQTAADFIRRLPLHRQLDASQAMIIKLSPAWLSWAQQALTIDATKNCHLNALQNGKLSIFSNNAALASQIKHQQQTLLNHFHKHGFDNVQEIVVRLRPPSLTRGEDNPNRNTYQADANDSKNHFTDASDDSLKAIESCGKMVNNDELSSALTRLSKTLKSSRSAKTIKK